MHRKRTYGAALWIALLAVFATLAGPIRAAQAHSPMTTPAQAAHTMDMDMSMTGHEAAAAAPCHDEGDATCARACFIAAQCLPARLERPPEPVRPGAPAAYAQPVADFGGVSTEPGEPPPR
ncbi:hypothetical protein BH09PSE2_BH09PSE2_12820 [soil metagenome]